MPANPHRTEEYHPMLSRYLLALAVTIPALPLAAQFDLEKRSSARLGQNLDLDIVGAPPVSFALIIPSATSGPTPLSLIDPADPRVLSVGTELLGVMAVVVTNGAGGAGYSVALPSTPSLSGFELHWQSATLAFGATLIGQLSNDVVTLTGVGNTGVLSPSSLQFARGLTVSLVDENNNNSAGDVLVVGGGAGTLTSATGLASSELWDFRRMSVSAGPSMASARALHSAVRLNDGRVLIIGGVDQNGDPTSSCEIYNPATNSFSSTGNMGTSRALFGACKLADGRVMVAGGTDTLQPDVVSAIQGVLDSAEIYNPATGSWSGTSDIANYRLAPALTLLPNGQAMVSGGVQVSFFFGIPVSASSTNNVQRWNPSNGNWSNGPDMAQGRAGHQYNQVRLNDGRILMTGGVNVPSLLGATNAAPISGAELYNPTSNSWQTVNMPSARTLHTATVLADGRVAVCGGGQGTLTAPTSVSSVVLFNPGSNSWSTAPNLVTPRASHTAQLMPDGMLILFGGAGTSSTLSSIETIRF
jgi:N-acetylneuraminic acid mutarotase